MEYRSVETRGPYPEVDIFPDLSPRAKPYCGVKCSQGLHLPATCMLLLMESKTGFTFQHPKRKLTYSPVKRTVVEHCSIMQLCIISMMYFKNTNIELISLM